MAERSDNSLNGEQINASARVLETLARAIDAAMASNGLSRIQWGILRALGSLKDRKPTVSDLADYIGLSFAPTSRALKSLAAKDLVKAEKDPVDTRTKLYELTSNGVEKLGTDPINSIAAALEALPPEDRLQFVSGAGRLTILLGQIANESSDRVFFSVSSEKGLNMTR